jgi:septation ring formation regulator EzrA
MSQEITLQTVVDLIKQVDRKIDQKFDGLTEVMLENFDNVYGRLDNVEERLDTVDIKLEKVEGRLDKIQIKLDKIEFQAPEKRLSYSKKK